MKLASQAFRANLDTNFRTLAEVRMNCPPDGTGPWVGDAHIDCATVGQHATRQAAQRALATALRAMADKVEADS